MRRAVAAVLLLAACAVPSGSEVPRCDDDCREVAPRIVTLGTGSSVPTPIECIRQIDPARVLIGFLMPAGPGCHVLTGVAAAESADAVSFTLHIAPRDDPNAGACPEEALRTTTELDLQAPVDGRTLLDGSR